VTLPSGGVNERPCIRTIAVIGAGTAGRPFALAYATAGFRVLLEDVMPANLRRAQQEYAQLASAAAAGTLESAATIEAAVREADLVVDFVPDELESKLEIFCLIDRMAPPKTIVLTPSNALSITDLASCTYRGDRCFAVRGPLAEVARGGVLRILHPPRCDSDALDATAEFLRTLGAVVTIELDRDTPMLAQTLGHSAQRLS
jgi:3-hydroxybutyryl-CoA dehydrogenase